jgi:flagellar biosynthesis component FlhA
MAPAELTEYFTAEKHGGYLLIVLSIAGFFLAAYLWFNRSAFMAMAWPLVVIGILALAVGLGVGLRTPSQVAALEQGLQTAKTETVASEIKRMERVNKSFRIIKIVEIALIAIGVLSILVLPVPGTWSAVGLGLLLAASVLLVFDTIAYQRALVYTTWLISMAG